jgi:hypothetical protein
VTTERQPDNNLLEPVKVYTDRGFSKIKKYFRGSSMKKKKEKRVWQHCSRGKKSDINGACETQRPPTYTPRPLEPCPQYVTQVVVPKSLAFDRGGPNSILVKFEEHCWWTKWHWNRLFCEHFNSPLSINNSTSPPYSSIYHLSD